MKKISFFIILLFTTGLILCCNKDSSSDSDTGYVDPGNWSGIDRNSSKAFTLGGFTSCSGVACLAIIFQGELSDTPYVGIAVKNASGSPKLKIYWPESSIPTGSVTRTCTVNYNGTITSNVTVTATITDNVSINGTYKILFTAAVSGTSIVNGNSIDALKI